MIYFSFGFLNSGLGKGGDCGGKGVRCIAPLKQHFTQSEREHCLVCAVCPVCVRAVDARHSHEPRAHPVNGAGRQKEQP